MILEGPLYIIASAAGDAMDTVRARGIDPDDENLHIVLPSTKLDGIHIALNAEVFATNQAGPGAIARFQQARALSRQRQIAGEADWTSMVLGGLGYLIRVASELQAELPVTLERAMIPSVGSRNQKAPVDQKPTEENESRRAVNSISDPTGQAVVQLEALKEHRIVLDPFANHVAKTIRAIHESVKDLRRAKNELAEAHHIPESQRPEEPPQAAACVNCARYDEFSVAVKGGRCDACYQYRLRSKDKLTDRPEALVVADKPGTKQREHVDPMAHRKAG